MSVRNKSEEGRKLSAEIGKLKPSIESRYKMSLAKKGDNNPNFNIQRSQEKKNKKYQFIKHENAQITN